MASPHVPIRPHSCKHCQRIVLRKENITQLPCLIKIPHTIAEIRQAAEDQCELILCFAAALMTSHMLHCSGCSGCIGHRRRHRSMLFGREQSISGRYCLRLSAAEYPPKKRLPMLGFWHYSQLGGKDVGYIQMIPIGVTGTPIHICPWHILIKTAIGEAASELNTITKGWYNADVASKSNLAVMYQWLKECHSSHALCGQKQVDFVPRRLLRIESTTEKTTVRLVEDLQCHHTRWAALSYVWGGVQSFQTTAASFASMQAGFGAQDLPLTLRDAVTVCIAMSLDYLWVDSLCIIQDDDEDLARELASMPQIYQRAWVTISASTAASVSEGFLQKRCYSHRALPISLPYLADDGSDAGEIVYVRHESACGDETEHINERAWTYQERRLSSRVLDFRHNYVALYCYEGKRCQGGGSKRWKKTGSGKRLAAATQEQRLYRPLSSHEELPPWHGIVDEYAIRQTSFPSDKLTALSALADLYKQSTGHTYIAGLWKESLMKDLCWSTRGGDIFWRPDVYRAPSWSWAAVDVARPAGAVSHSMYHRINDLTKNPKTTIMDFAIEQEPPNTTFGKIHAGFLELRAPVLWTEWPSHDESMARMNLSPSVSVKVFQDAKEHGRLDWEVIPVLAVLLMQQVHPRRKPYDGLPNDMYHWLPRKDYSRQYRARIKRDRGSFTHHGLMLVEDPPGKYRRIGMFVWEMNRNHAEDRRLHARFRVRTITIL